MSLKAIDLQMALHRNDEAGVRQNQLLHKPEVDQVLLAGQAAKQTERAREQTAKLEHAAEMHIRDQGKQAGGEQGERQRRGRSEPEPGDNAEPKTPPHPFKGHFLDVSL
ncbi:hypothetical protein SD70_21350 [Gordoniibacillus kamchatkensis]|uniref:Uncharacterized protein n=1 Tax=Gordoniibacillus kamchatkensis TaxID=1590651 RepID=A0ABR5AFS8_9BACL|nr:hypothetical protein [Paenibacillus sp. VKM B-2647]KIL39222.1 hypothetical protein SD70_21350 [Paenibacillus sp. VKM B-2647]